MQESGTRVLAPSLALAVRHGHLHPPPQAPALSMEGHWLQGHIHRGQNLLLLLEGGRVGGVLLKRLFLLPFDPSLLETLNIA